MQGICRSCRMACSNGLGGIFVEIRYLTADSRGKMIYRCDCDFIDYEIVKKEKTGRKYIYYHFRDIESGDIHVVYDHKNDSETAKLIELHRHRVLRIEGRVTASGSHQYLNLDRWGVVIDDLVYDPVTMNQGYRKVE